MSEEWPTESHNYGIPKPLDLSPEDRLVAQIVISLAKTNPNLITTVSPQQVDDEVREQLGLPLKYNIEKKDASDTI